MKNFLYKIYNNLVFLTRNKHLYLNNNISDTFSNRLILLFFHFAFFLKMYKKDNNKQLIQKIYDFIFKQIEISLRETGHGDVNVNKKMKEFINIFHNIIEKIDSWESYDVSTKNEILKEFVNTKDNLNDLGVYFEKYLLYLANYNLNFFAESVNKHKF